MTQRIQASTSSRGLAGLRAASLAVLALLAAACSSDDFSGVGGKLPTDVGQDADSIGVYLPPVYPTQAVVVTPLDTLAATERPALFIGARAEGGWRATPLIRFDTDFAEIADQLPLGWSDVNKVQLRIVRLLRPEEFSVIREVTAYELASPLTEDALLVADHTSLLGAELGPATWNKAGEAVVELDPATVQSWFEMGAHNGIALVHETAVPDSLYSNFGGLAGVDYPSRSRLEIEADREFVGPVLRFELSSGAPDENSFSIEAVDTWTHFERPPAAGDLQIGSYFERRLWLGFDLGPDLVPVDATINVGTLTLQVREDPTMQVRSFTRVFNALSPVDLQVRGWEAVRSEAGDDPAQEEAWGKGRRQLLGAREEFNPEVADPEDLNARVFEITLDVTEYVQRQVNQVAPEDLPAGSAVEDVGILLGFTAEQLDLCTGAFYGLDQTDDLKPRLEIRYTPPADTWK